MQPCSHPDPFIRGGKGAGPPKIKNKGGLGPLGPFPGSATARVVPYHSSVIFSDSFYVRRLSKTDNGFCPSSMHLR